MEIEIRAGFCDPGGELLAGLERSGWQRITPAKARDRRRDRARLRGGRARDRRGVAEAPRFAAVRDRLPPPFTPAERAMTAPGSPPTMAPADLLIGLLERVPMTEAQIARATQVEPATIRVVAPAPEGSCRARGSAADRARGVRRGDGAQHSRRRPRRVARSRTSTSSKAGTPSTSLPPAATSG